MHEQFSRTARLLGADKMEKLFASKVAVFGIGGVGGHCAEALARSGVGLIDLYDHDRVCLTNLNRQIIATHKTVGLYKVDAMRDRILDINPEAAVAAYRTFYSPETAPEIDLSKYDYIVDAIDTMTGKLELVCRAEALGVRIISSMGAANKLDPTAFRVSDIYATSVCPLARIMRSELRKRGVKALKVVYSTEPAIKPFMDQRDNDPEAFRRRQVPASNSFVPPVAGLIIAGEIIKDLTPRRDAEPTGLKPDPIRDRACDGV